MSDKFIDFSEKKEEIEKMRQVSALISEVRPYFLKQKRERKKRIKIAAACLLLMFTLASMPVLNKQYDIINTIAFHNLEAEDLGFPVDEYGFIMVQ